MTTPSARITVVPQPLHTIGQQVGSTQATMATAATLVDQLSMTEGTAGPALAELGYLASYANFQLALSGALRRNASSVQAGGQHLVQAALDYQQVDDAGVPLIRTASRPEPV